MDKIEYDELFEDDENGEPKEPFKELVKKINEIVEWVNTQ